MASQLSEEKIKEALRLAHTSAADIAKSQLELISQSNNTRTKFSPFKVSQEMGEAVMKYGYPEAEKVYDNRGSLSREERTRQEGALRAKIMQWLADHEVFRNQHIVSRAMAAESMMAKAFRNTLLAGRRTDGRQQTQVRPLSCTADVLPSAHGSAFFCRGDTHVICSTTLGSREEAKLMAPFNGMPERDETFFLHYEFPPHSTGELGNATALNRRMIGHGNLAERAVRPVVPDVHVFPYTVRATSECTSSNGSSSMASVCGVSMSLMDAGVPVKAAVAGVSVGLVTDDGFKKSGASSEGKYRLLTDILGMEDHYGDMDFKIAGSAEGITAVQLDVKLPLGVPLPILEEGIDQARSARLQILNAMKKAIGKPRESIKPFAPRSAVIQFDPERKKHIVGPQGEMITFIRETYHVDVEMSEPGVAYIFGRDVNDVEEARRMVLELVADIKEGDVHSAEVVEIKEFGAIVKLTRAQEALLHISEITSDPVLLKKPVNELLALGQRFDVQVLQVDKSVGLIRVSRRKLLPADLVKDKLKPSPPKPSAHAATDGAAATSFPTTPPRAWDRNFFM